MRKVIFAPVAIVTAVSMCIPAIVAATHGPGDNPPRDFAAGRGAPASGTPVIAIGASSGPLSELGLGSDPRGHVTVDFGTVTESGRVECFVAVGNRAVAGIPTEFLGRPDTLFVFVEDNGRFGLVPDRVQLAVGGVSEFVPTCTAHLGLAAGAVPIDDGDFVVHDGAAAVATP